MVNDRGTKKWTSLMLPEHVEMLQKLWAEDKKVPRPSLSQDDFEQMDQIINLALYQNVPVVLTAYQDEQTKVYQGHIKNVSQQKKALTMCLIDSITTVTIPLPEIIDLDIM